MAYIIVSLLVPLLLMVFLPSFLARMTAKSVQRNYLLIIACLLYFISWYLPSPLIEGRNTAFTTHVVGGGLFSGVLWLYVKQQLRWRSTILSEFITLFACVSALGVLNELAEFALVEFGIIRELVLTDTSWDLVANTLGVLIFWAAYMLIAHRFPKD